MRSKPVARRLHAPGADAAAASNGDVITALCADESNSTQERLESLTPAPARPSNGFCDPREACRPPGCIVGSRAGQERGCGQLSPQSTDESDCASDTTAAPTLVPLSIKQDPDTMPPGGPDFYSGLTDLGVRDAETYLSRPYSPDEKNPFTIDPRNLHDLRDYRLSFPFQPQSPVKPLTLDDKSPDKVYPLDLVDSQRCEDVAPERAVERVPGEVMLRDGGVWARSPLSAGTKYGPFLGKWESQPLERRFAWEVIARNGMHGWLDATAEQSNWLKFIRSTNQTEDINVEHILLAGQVWYRVRRDVRAGEELVLGPRTPLPLQDVLAAAGGVHGDGRERHEGEEEEEEAEESEPRCSVCDSPFPDIDSLDLHQVRAHRQQAGTCPCDRCPRAYSSRALLLRHRALSHSDLRKFSCENCPKVFTDPSNLQRHIRAQHVGARSHACPECGKTFATSSGLKQHTHIHSSVKPFQCEVCFKAYTQFSNLCRHKRMHSNCRSQIKCGKCAQTFNTITSLTKHKRFCDSAGSGPTVNLPSQLPQGMSLPPLPGMANPNNPSPFPMYRSPLSFPFNTFHFPGLFQSAPTPSFLTPLLFNSHSRMLEQNMIPKPERRPSVTSLDSAVSSEDAKRAKSVNGEPIKLPTDRKKDRRTPTILQSLATKISPPSAEEASSHLRPSPARPQPAPVVPLKLPREEQRTSPYEFTIKTDNDETQCDVKRVASPCLPKDMSIGSAAIDDVNISDDSDVEEDAKKDGGEQPLDLSVSRKRRYSECIEVDTDDRSLRNSSVKSYSSPETPERAPSAPLDNNSDAEVDVESEEPRANRATATRPRSPRPSPPLAYPRPVHPSLLEAMYSRPGFPSFRAPSGETMLAPPHSPYVPFNFLSPMLGVDGVDRAEALRAPGVGYAKFRDPIGAGGKMRDRYACKYCGKVFPRSANLTRHLRTHTGEQPYKCKYCERSFSISSNLQRHVRNIHNKERPFRCPMCERCFGQQTNLDRHLKKHEGEGADSPSSADTEREDTIGYFDEIRSFMGKVGCSSPARSPSAPRSPHPAHPTHPALRTSALTVST